MVCDKIGYDSITEALQHVKGMAVKLYKNKKHSYKTYKCLNCDKYHVSTENKHKLKPIKENKYPMHFDYHGKPKNTYNKKENRNIKKLQKVVPQATSPLLSKEQAEMLKRLIEAKKN
jgi:hypothetical protein